MEKETKKIEVQNITDSIVPKLVSFVRRPTFVWYFTYYIMSMLGGMVIGVAMDGPIGIFTYGKRIVELYIYFGLNNNSTKTVWLQYNPWAFFLAPFFSMILGPLLYLLPLGGWAINGPRINDPDGKFYGMFFRDPVPGAEVYFYGNVKFNIFYIVTVWMPIAVTILISMVYNKRTQRSPNMIAISFINLFLAWFVAIPVAEIGGDLSWSWRGFFNSLIFERSFDFQNRVVNQFIVYDGMYHPGAVAMTAWLVTFLPIIFYALIGYIYSREYTLDPFRDLQRSIMKRFTEIPEELPWEEDEKVEKQKETEEE